LNNPNKAATEVENIKSCWIIENLSETQSNRGTARLIAETGTEYLNQYQTILNATGEEFKTVLQKYLTEDPLLRIYSSDAKK
ncbi:MAG: hypothetical protein IIT58_08610, partial [Treponema sp.]|nr:hypothetical protein [Treponema sp.]